MKTGFYKYEVRKNKIGVKITTLCYVDFNKYKPHYGNQAAARNFRHRQAHTHGL